MSVEEKKAFVRHVVDEFFHKGNLDLVDEVFADDYVFGTRPVNRGAIKGSIAALRAAFPDLRVEVSEIVVEGDWIAWRRTISGTHQGKYMGIPATGKKVTWQTMVTSHIVDGKVVEEWGVEDRLGLLRQLGAELVLPEGESDG